MTIHENLEQGTDDWLELKRGKLSASNFGKLFAGKGTDKYKGYLNKLVFERLSGTIVDSYKSPAMQRGNDLEPFAREEYQLKTFNLVKEVGLIEVDENIVVSPDGLIGSDGGLEIKCLEHNALINFLMTKKIPTDYQWQIQGCLWASEREWWDYYVYHPNLPTSPVRIYRDEKEIDMLEKELKIAVEMIEFMTKKLRT